MSLGDSLIGCELVEADRLVIGLRHTATGLVEEAEIGLSPRVSLIGCQLVEAGRLCIRPRHTATLGVEETEIILSLRVSLIGCEFG